MEKIKSDPDSPYTVEQLYDSAIKYIHVVRITIDDGEDPADIFKSLNDTGTQLSCIDLIRNHILMKLKLDQEKKIDYQKQFYEDSWKPFEDFFNNHADGSKSMEDFLRRLFDTPGKILIFF